MRAREIVLMGCLLASACSSFEAESVHPLIGDNSAFASAGGRTFFVGRQSTDDATRFDIVLGTTDGLELDVEHRVERAPAWASAANDIWASSADEVWAIASDRLFRRDASGWREITLSLDEHFGGRVALLGITGTGDGVAVSAWYDDERWDEDPSADTSTVAIVRVDSSGAVAIEALPEAPFADAIETNAQGELLVLGPTLLVSRGAGWEAAAGWPEDDHGWLWRGRDGAGYGFRHAELARWSGEEVITESLPIDHSPTGEAGDLTESIEDVLAIGEEIWVLIGVHEYGCTPGFFTYGTCGYGHRSYRAIRREGAGAWEDAAGVLQTTASRGYLVAIEGDVWLALPDRELASTHLARFGR